MRAVHTESTNGEQPRIKRLPRRHNDDPLSRLPLHDLELERAFLGSCIAHPELVMESKIVAADFYSPANEIIFDALLHLVADGIAVDTMALRARIEDAGRLEDVGGADYVLRLTDGIPLKRDYSRLRKLARHRHVREAAMRLIGSDLDDVSREWARLQTAKAELDALDTDRRYRIPDLATVIENLTFDPRRMPTGLPTLDAALRGGGVPPGSFCVFNGAPGSAKTTLTVWLGEQWERLGAEVLFLAADEPLPSICQRYASARGMVRDAFESPMPTARKAFADELRRGDQHFTAIDPFDESVTLEEAAEYLELIAGDRIRVLIVDSLQEVPCAAAAEAATDYERVSAVAKTCARIAKRGTIVLAISEMSRGGYAGPAQSQTSTLGSAKGSSRIEYGASLVMGLRAVLGVDGGIDIDVAKSRLGRSKPKFRLQLDFDGLQFVETDVPDPEVAKAQREECAVRRSTEELLQTVRNNADLKTKDDLWKAAGGNRTKCFRLIADLERTGTIAKVNGVYRVVPGGNGE